MKWEDMDYLILVVVEPAINATDRGVAGVDLGTNIEEISTPTEAAAEEETLIMPQRKRGAVEIGARIAITTTGAVARGMGRATITKKSDSTEYFVLNLNDSYESLPALYLSNTLNHAHIP